MEFRRSCLSLILLLVTGLSASDPVNLPVLLRPFYENRQLNQALSLVGTNTPAEFYLRASLYSEQGLKMTAFSNYMRATNDVVLRNYAFYHAGLCFRADSNTNGLRYLSRAEKADNIILKYYAALAIGDFYDKRGKHDRSYASYSRAYESLLNMEGPYYRLTDVLGNYYKSKNEFLIGRELHLMKRPESPLWLLRVLRTGGDGRNNPYVAKAIVLLTNYPLTTHGDNALMASQMLKAKMKGKKARSYVEAALQKANSGQTLFEALEMLLEFDIHKDRALAEKQLKIYGLYFQNSNWQDGILYYQGLLANVDKRTQTAISNFSQVLGNPWRMRQYEERSLLAMAGIKKNSDSIAIRTLLTRYKTIISNSQPLTDFFFRYALEKFRPRKDYTNALFFYTNLPPQPSNLFLRADAYLILKNKLSAVDCYQRIIRENSSDYYTALSLRELKKLLDLDTALATRFTDAVADLKRHIDIRNDAPSLLNMKYLKVLSYEPGFVLSANLFDSILRTNLYISPVWMKADKAIPQRAKYCFDNFLDAEGRMELYAANVKGLGMYRNLAEYFERMQYPYMQIKYSETVKDSLGINFPFYRMEHRTVRSLFPNWYQTNISRSATEYKVQPGFIYAIMREESRYRYDAKSPVGAMGLMQVMPDTFQDIRNDIKMAHENILNPDANIKAGVYYLSLMNQRFKNPLYAAAAYNAGPNAVGSWIEKFPGADEVAFIELIPYRETRNYVKKVFYSMECYKTVIK